jgi:hypothetical protein
MRRHPALHSAGMKRLALTAALLLVACGGATLAAVSTVPITQTRAAQPTVTQTAGNTPPPPAPKTVIDPRGAAWPIIDRDGTYLVLADILPGTYRNAGGTMCYWARLRGPDPSDILDSKKTGDPQVIGIRNSDIAFLTQNCGTWQMTSVVP